MRVNEYKIVGKFECNGKLMIIVKMENATHIMPEIEWKWIYSKLHSDRWENEKQGQNVA